jgi:hypothetical protein
METECLHLAELCFGESRNRDGSVKKIQQRERQRNTTQHTTQHNRTEDDTAQKDKVKYKYNDKGVFHLYIFFLTNIFSYQDTARQEKTKQDDTDKTRQEQYKSKDEDEDEDNDKDNENRRQRQSSLSTL